MNWWPLITKFSLSPKLLPSKNCQIYTFFLNRMTILVSILSIPGTSTTVDRVVLSDLPSWGQLRKRVLFYFQKLSSVPVTQLRRKSLQVLRLSHDLIRLFIKKLKKFHKKIIFSMILLAIILLPLKYPFWINSKLRQFSHFLQQIK